MEQRHEIIQFSDKIPGKIFLHKLGSVPKHWHRSIEVLFALTGETNVLIDDRSYTMRPTDVIVINSLSVHELYSEGAELVAFQMNLSKFPSFEAFKDCYFDCCSCDDTENPRYDYLRHVLARLIKENTDTENVLLSHALISLLLNELVTNFQMTLPDNAAVKKKALQKFSKITDYINSHYSENLSLAAVAETFHFSQAYLSRVFKQTLGVTYSDFYNNIRLERAVNEMLSSDHSISQIAVNSGFSDARAMTAQFKKKYHMLPSGYRASRPSYIPKEKIKNEINYLAVTTSASLTSLAQYLNIPDVAHEYMPAAPREELFQIPAVDVQKNGKKLRHTWRKVCCVGSTRDLLFSDVQEMLKKLQKDMPFTYIKFHGLLSDDLTLYDENAAGEPVYSFTLLDKVFDFLQSIGLKPLMQFSFMPAALASNPDKTVFFTKQNASPPKSIERWNQLIKAVVLHCIERYSLGEVLTWPICVWNEPDTTPEMFGFPEKEDFFALYENTYKTVKSIHPDFHFGSPSLLFLPEDQLDWYHPFFDYCKEHACFPDFINLHYYDDDIEILNDFSSGEQLLNKLKPTENSFSAYLDSLYSHLEEYHLSNTPFYMTEWNLTISHRNLINDTCFKACYLTKNLLENYDRLESFGYWSLTDFLCELQLPKHLYHGGLGLFTMNGIPKSHYYAFLFISKLGDTLISSGPGWFITKQSATGNIQMIFYNYSHYDKLFSSGEIFDMTMTNRYTSFSDMKKKTITVTLQNMDLAHCRIRESYINQNAGSSYDTWIHMGGIELTRQEDLDYLYHHSNPGCVLRETTVESGTLTYAQTLEPLEIRLVEILKI